MPIFQNPQLDGKEAFLQGNSSGVLLIHGFTATAVEVKLLADPLHQLGMTVSTPLLPGHGTTPQDLNRIHYQDWINYVENCYQYLKKHCKKIAVGGESMGAVIALHLAEKHPEIGAILLYSPAIHIKSLKYAGFLKLIKPIMNKTNNDPQDTQWQGYTVYPIKAAAQFRLLQREVEKNLALVGQPALILQGMYDETIDKDSGQIIYNQISSSRKELIFMKKSGHVMLLDNEIDRITDLTIQFLQSADIL